VSADHARTSREARDPRPQAKTTQGCLSAQAAIQLSAQAATLISLMDTNFGAIGVYLGAHMFAQLYNSSSTDGHTLLMLIVGLAAKLSGV
jgi:hypothetical protein